MESHPVATIQINSTTVTGVCEGCVCVCHIDPMQRLTHVHKKMRKHIAYVDINDVHVRRSYLTLVQMKSESIKGKLSFDTSYFNIARRLIDEVGPGKACKLRDLLLPIWYRENLW